MLPDVHRMRASGDFTVTVRTGVRAARPCVVVHARSSEFPTQVGFVVSKAVGNSVMRNRVKRRLRHCVRDVIVTAVNGDVALPGVQAVVRALPRSAQASFADLSGEVEAAWRQAERKLATRGGVAQR